MARTVRFWVKRSRTVQVWVKMARTVRFCVKMARTVRFWVKIGPQARNQDLQGSALHPYGNKFILNLVNDIFRFQ